MPPTKLHQLQLAHPTVREHLASGKSAQATSLASNLAADALSDLATSHIAAGRFDQGMAMLKASLQLNTACNPAFHNMIAASLKSNSLRNETLMDIRRHLLLNWRNLPWANEYHHLFFLPGFLNIEFVHGKCNLKCRMCIGVNGPNHPNKLSYLEAADFRRMLENAPTISGVTLSSGDSDPLLHPQIDEIIDIARERKGVLDFYTNGLPLSARTARKMVESGSVGMINFSIDAATPETYAKVRRGGDFAKLLSKIRMLHQMKQEKNAKLPGMSVSFVGMADTIHELPAFVDLASELGAARIVVGDLSGWLGDAHGNHPATDNPRAGEYVDDACHRAEAANIDLQLHEGLQQTLAEYRSSNTSNIISTAPPSQQQTHEVQILAHHLHVVQDQLQTSGNQLACCSWIDGIWVNGDGKLQPCCMIRNPADMGSIHDGPLHENEKYLKVKSLLLTGKVFESCRDQRMCRYVQQRKAAGDPLNIITNDELGDLAPTQAEEFEPYPDENMSNSLSLTVLNA